MTITIKDGLVLNANGDGVRVEEWTGSLLISGMTIVNSTGSGIVVGRSSEQTLSLDRLLDEIANRLSELSENDRSKVQDIIGNIRSDPSTENTNMGIKAIYDITIGAAGSTIGSLLVKLIGA